MPVWREAQFEVGMHETPRLPNAFGIWDVQKVHGFVARFGVFHLPFPSGPQPDRPVFDVEALSDDLQR